MIDVKNASNNGMNCLNGSYPLTIVKPVISDGACRSLILQNKDFYMDLINTAGDDAYELKKSLRNLIQKDSDPQLVKFVNSIDSVPEVETA